MSDDCLLLHSNKAGTWVRLYLEAREGRPRKLIWSGTGRDYVARCSELLAGHVCFMEILETPVPEE